MKLLTIPASDWAEFRCKGALPESLHALYDAAYNGWLHAHPEYQGLGIGDLFPRKSRRPGLRMRPHHPREENRLNLRNE